MSFLTRYRKSVRHFDPYNDEHREWFHRYVTTGSWANCPIQFEANDTTGCDIATIQRQMAEYYSKQEFGEISR